MHSDPGERTSGVAEPKSIGKREDLFFRWKPSHACVKINSLYIAKEHTAGDKAVAQCPLTSAAEIPACVCRSLCTWTYNKQ